MQMTSNAVQQSPLPAFAMEPKLNVELGVDAMRAANLISDVIMNRPAPLREFDQIYMRAGDMVRQSLITASWARDKRLAFIGDGDGISVAVAHLMNLGALTGGPREITVFDFDERIVAAINSFSTAHKILNLRAVLYNCLDPFPEAGAHEFFYTNPPWGASNNGHSVTVFAQRGMEATAYVGEGMIVIADDDKLSWPGHVLAHTQAFATRRGYFVAEMGSKLHGYHLDDAPDLKSCNLVIRSVTNARREVVSAPIEDEQRLKNFYGRNKPPHVRYVRTGGNATARPHFEDLKSKSVHPGD